MNRSWLRDFWRNDEGTGMVEFALVGALFTAIILAILEFGLAVWERNNVASDAREGSRYAVVRGANSGNIATPDSVSNYVKSRTVLNPTQLRVYTTWTPDKTPGSLVSVSVAHNVPRRGPFIPAHIDSATSKLYIYY